MKKKIIKQSKNDKIQEITCKAMLDIFKIVKKFEIKFREIELNERKK